MTDEITITVRQDTRTTLYTTCCDALPKLRLSGTSPESLERAIRHLPARTLRDAGLRYGRRYRLVIG